LAALDLKTTKTLNFRHTAANEGNKMEGKYANAA
jgi:hypothetical protein